MIFKLPVAVATLVLMCQCILPTDDSELVPSITRHPEDVWLTDLDILPRFSVSAKGTALSFQWQKNRYDIPGATLQFYEVFRLSPADSTAQFRCIVSNFAGSDTSNEAKIVWSRYPRDITPPTITLIGDSIVYIPIYDPENMLNRYCSPDSANVTYSDDHDSEMAYLYIYHTVNQFNASLNPYSITYIALDSSGNEAEVVRKVIIYEPLVSDTLSPILQVLTDGVDVIYLPLGATFTQADCYAFDFVDGELTHKIQIKGTVDTSKPGTYEQVYSVSDAAGNTNEVHIRIVVEPQQTQ